MSIKAARRLWRVAALLLMGWGLRCPLLLHNEPHPDEALFAALARTILTEGDPLLRSPALLVDKPPLFYFQLAAGISMDWASPLTARLPGLFAAMLSLALLSRLGGILGRGERAAVLAAALGAFSPLGIVFAPTAFADSLMVAWWLAALLAAFRGRSVWAGLLSGLAVATKQNALFLLPLPLLIGLWAACAPGKAAWLVRWAAGLLPIIALMFLWDGARGVEVGFWVAGVEYNNPARFIRSDELLPRLSTWLGYLGLAGGGWLTLAVTVFVAGWAWARRPGPLAMLVIGFCLAYFGFHWLVAFPLLDRYMLPLAWLLPLLSAWGAAHTAHPRLAALALVMLTVLAGLTAYLGRWPLGAHFTAMNGLSEAAEHLRTYPEGTVVYHQSLGWPLANQLYDAPLYLAAYGHPAGLYTDLRAFGAQGTPRLIIFSGTDSPIEALYAVRQAGFAACPVFEVQPEESPGFEIYLIRQAAC